MPRNWLECTKFADKSFILAGDTGQTEARVALHPVRTTLCIYRRQLFQRMHSLSRKRAAGDPGFNECIPKQSCMYWLTTGLVLKLKFIYRVQGYPGQVNVAFTYFIFMIFLFFFSSASKNKSLNPLYSGIFMSGMNKMRCTNHSTKGDVCSSMQHRNWYKKDENCWKLLHNNTEYIFVGLRTDFQFRGARFNKRNSAEQLDRSDFKPGIQLIHPFNLQ